MADDPSCVLVTDSHSAKGFRVGTQADVEWIDAGTGIGLTITAAIPPDFDAYATVVIPENDDFARRRHDRAVLEVLAGRSSDQSWWLGYLRTGPSDVLFPRAPTVQLYPGWSYVLIEAGPEDAAGLRAGAQAPFERSLPELIFPADRSWLLSTMWDDDWRCLGGPADLIDGFAHHPDLETRAVRLGEHSAPPGHRVI